MREPRRFIDGIGVGGIDMRFWQVEQFACLRDIIGTAGPGKQTVVSDVLEAAWQDLDQESADELVAEAVLPRCIWLRQLDRYLERSILEA